MKKILLFAFAFISYVGFSQTFNGSTGAIPDNAGPTCFNVNVTGLPSIIEPGGLGLTSVCLDITHTYDGDLDIYLFDPYGNSIELSTDNGGGGNDYTGTCFTISATNSITSGAAPFTGDFTSEGGCLSSMTQGQDPNGVWQLCITDDAGGDVGTLNSWSLDFGTIPFIAADVCANATSICNLDGYYGTTSACYPVDGSMTFCGSIENNSWLSFEADNNGAVINVQTSNCVNSGDDIQMSLYEGTCGSLVYAGGNSSNCVSPVNGMGAGGTDITFTGLTSGQTYYLMIDGFAGNVCNYSVTAVDGVAVNEIESSQGDTVCPTETTDLTVVSVGATPTSYSWSSVPAGGPYPATPTITVTPGVTTTYTCVVGGSCGSSTTISTTIVVQNPNVFYTGLPANMQCSDAPADLFADSEVTPCIYVEIFPTNTQSTPVQTLTLEEGGVAYWGTNTVAPNVNSTMTFYQVSPSLGHQLQLYGNTSTDMSFSVYDCANHNLLTSGTWTAQGTPQTQTVSVPGPVTGLATWTTTCGGGSLFTDDWGYAQFDPGAVPGPFPYSCDITYNWDSEDGCSGSETQTVTVTSPNNAAFNYASATYCQSGPDPTPTITGSGTGSFSSTAGLSINSSGLIDVSASTPGTYTVSHTLGTGNCQDIQTFDVTIDPSPTATVSGGGTICAGDPIPDVTITLTGTGPWSVTYSDGSTSTTVNPASSPYTISGGGDGTYTVTAVSDANCAGTSSGSATITTNPLPTATVSGGGTICAGDPIPDVTITLTGSGPWSVTYSDGSTSTTVNPASSPYTISGGGDGTYTVTAVSDVNCTGTSSGSATITTNPLPTATVSGGGTICAGDPIPDVTITLTGSGPWSVTYSDGSTSTTVNPASSPYTISGGGDGTYTVTSVSDVNCTGTSSGSATITTNPLPTAVVSGGGAICAGDAIPDVTITLTGNGPWSVTYSDGSTSTTVNPVSSPYTISGGGDGTYTVTAVSDVNCTGTSSGSATITTNPLPTAGITPDPAEVCEGVNLTLDGNPAGGGGSYTHLWSGTGAGSLGTTNSASATFNNGTAGTYNLTYTVTDQFTCSASDNITVTVHPTPTATISGGGTYCSTSTPGDLTITFTGTPPFDFTYTDGTTPVNITGHNGMTYTIAAPTAGTYTVSSVSDDNGCAGTTSGSETVTIYTMPAAPTAGTDAVYCNGDVIADLFAVGTGGTLTWYDDAGLTNVVGTGTSLTPSGAIGTTTYYVTETDPSGTCEGPATPVVITVNDTPTIVSATSTDVTNCTTNDGTITIDVTGGTGSYSYSIDGGATYTASGNPFNATGLGVNSYQVMVDDGNCVTSGPLLTIAGPGIPSAPVAGTNATYCDGDVIADLTATAVSGTLTWYDDAGLSNVVGTGGTYSPSSAVGSYTYYVTETIAGCEGPSSQVTVDINPTPIAPSVTGGNTYCDGDPVADLQASAGGPNSGVFYWFDDAGLTSNVGSGPVMSPSSAVGSYTYYVVDSLNGCVGPAAMVTVDVNPTPVFAVVPTDPLTCGGTEGELLITGLLNNTSYDVSYSDGGVGSGTLTMTSNGSGEIAITGLDAGSYTVVTVTLNGCSTTDGGTYTLIDPSAPTFTVGTTDPTSCGGMDGEVILSGLTPGTTYSLSYTDDGNLISVSVTADVNGDIIMDTLNAGTYANFDITLTGCTSSMPGPYTLSDPNAPVFTIGGTQDPTGCGTADGIITLTGLTPSTSYNLTYNYNGSTVGPVSITTDPSGNYDITGLVGGTYDNFSVDLAGCVGSDPGTYVLAPIYPAAPVAGTDTSYCVGETMADLTAVPAFGGQINWYDDAGLTNNVGANSTTYTPTMSVPGTYTFYVTETLAGCEGPASSVTITINPQPGAPVVVGDTTYCEGETIVDLTAVPQGGGSIVWYDDAALTNQVGTGNTFSPAGTLGVTTYYAVEVQGICESVADSAIVTVSSGPIASFNPTPPSGSVPLDVYFDNTSTGANTYLWSFGDGNTSSTFDPNNVYQDWGTFTASLTVTDTNGCSSSYSVDIIVTGVSELIIPNVFTPNGDGMNEVFALSGTNIVSVEGIVMNRWGQTLFEINALQAGWDGMTLAGKPAAEGTYYYIITAEGADGVIYEYQGNFQLVR